ncbi:3-phosphoserine/phosphohydroxythreonine transaminase [Alkalibaculum sp. M08DMB]|uniref:Phosphoserine aminotransferase n=1 Tax=Alkalibaculum sporogenes TaxID=2655001 RepID=A0A6A7KC50_9FIRM|nr:3-phosphoserine/phosphohydroxythreonine transaminase [Alkalibaculum sporogenes]MPW27110.1 3-phosphoserine/phosphohydroxythreonine transaminase [Alkalibaculum sporogenes]
MTQDRVFNFSAGPSVLPEEVLLKASNEMLSYGNSGMSVMEMSHRSKDFLSIIESAESHMRSLMKIPDNYKVLFLQGGASLQFSMIPMNLFIKHKKADFIDTGAWSTKAIKEAKIYGEANVLATSKEQVYSYIPKLDSSSFSNDVDYFHITVNNTIYGTRYTPENIPNTGSIPLVADMSSNILSEAYDINKFSLIYAGAQKNIGPAGLTVVIIKDDLIGKAMDSTPTILDYKTHVDNDSLYNTPPCYSIYICKLVLEWILGQGGVKGIEQINKYKSNLLYSYLDESNLFKGTVVKEDRSLMNIPFITGNDELDALFIKEATSKGFVNLKGHRSVGGMRASIYNAMPVDGVQKLIALMKEFEVNHK